MTSKERKAARYERRKAKRDAKAAKSDKTFEEIFTPANLMKAGKACCKNARWKGSTINFEALMLKEVGNLIEELNSGVHKPVKFNTFFTNEHGKMRQIDALKIADRVIQKCLVTEYLMPLFSRSFIYDNGACLKGKGFHFTVNRLKEHLHKHYRRHGLQGGIYQFDFKGYFGSLPHEEIKNMSRKMIKDDRVYDLFCAMVDDFQNLGNRTDETKCFGVGLGSEISQCIGLMYASYIDHYIKDQCGFKFYARYNDDGYIICEDIDRLYALKDELEKLAAIKGIAINPKKNVVIPLKQKSFKFLKLRFTLTETGKVYVRPARVTINRTKRKLKTFRKWMDTGIRDHGNPLTFEEIASSYQSFRSYIEKFNSYQSLRSMDAFFINLYRDELAAYRIAFKCTYPVEWSACGWQYAV